jgi:hypothetical protein
MAMEEARTARLRMTAAGGQLTVSSAAGTRITLSVPPEALFRSEDVTITIVSTVSGLPFRGALLAAVRVTPDDLALRVPATLRVETRGGLTQDQELSGQDQELAGFAIRDGRELHLYRADRIEDVTAKRASVELRLARFGSYGVARATAGEVAAASRRVPSGYMARLEQLIAQAFPSVGQPRAQASRWHLFPVVYAQEAPTPTPEWLSNLFRALEQTYEQVIAKQFEYIPEHGCESITSRVAIADYWEWATLPALLFPVERGSEPWEVYWKLVVQREDLLHARGYTPAQIAEIDAAMDAFRKERLSQLLRRGGSLVDEAYRRLFAKMYECCRWGRPMQYQLDVMAMVRKEAALQGRELDDGQDKFSECSCRVASMKQGAPEIWTGTITHVEDYLADEEQTQGTRTTRAEFHVKYRHELVLYWADGPGHMVGHYTIDGRILKQHVETTDRKSCGNITVSEDVSGSARDDDQTGAIVVEQSKQPGKYRISYPVNGATGSGLWKRHWSALGCQIFNPVRDDGAVKPVTIVGHPQSVDIETEVDPKRPYRLSGSKVLQVPDVRFAQPHRPKITWKLERCGG